jgi:hypothetical protein
MIVALNVAANLNKVLGLLVEAMEFTPIAQNVNKSRVKRRLPMSDLDELMSRDPIDLSAQDIDAIIAFHRAQRARKASGEKPAKTASASVDISSITKKLINESKPKVVCDRRI